MSFTTKCRSAHGYLNAQLAAQETTRLRSQDKEMTAKYFSIKDANARNLKM